MDKHGQESLPHERLALRPADAAAAIGVGRSTLYQMIGSGELRAITLGRALLIPRRELERWLAEKLER